MAGGTTNHFWPVSRESRPKQFLDISGSGKSFIRLTYERFSKVVPRENILVVTLSRFGEIVREQIPELPAENLLLEPYSRNTAPCIAYSTYEVLRRNPEATIVATPADHIIRDVDLFCKVMENVLEYAESNDVLMTVGILPDKPDTNYGYIQVKGGKATADSDKPLQVKTFVEKPDRALAEVFCNSEEFYWNSGIFVWKAAIIKEEMEKYIPDVTALFRGWETILGTPGEKEFLEKAYSDCQKISIDYAGNFGWFDIETWDTLFRMIERKDREGNALNTINSLLREDKDNLVITENKKKIYAIKGLKDYLVIDTEDALLICPREDKQFKDFISGLGMPEYEDFR